MTKIKDEKMALELFESAAIEHARSSENSDYKRANSNHDVIVKAMAFLKNRGEVKLLSKFLSHDSEGVRVWAAAYLLPIREENAVKVLEAIADGPRGIQRLNAATTLSEWRKGNLKL